MVIFCVIQWHLCFLCWNRDIFEQDNYSPIPVETEEEYKAVVSRFPFHDAEIEKVCQTLTNDQLIEVISAFNSVLYNRIVSEWI